MVLSRNSPAFASLASVSSSRSWISVTDLSTWYWSTRAWSDSTILCRRSSSRLAQRARVSCSSSGLIRKSVAPASSAVVADVAVVDDGDHDDRHVDAVGEPAELLDELDAVELGQLVVGEDDVDAVVARVLERAARRVEELEVELAVDLADDLGQQQPAAEQVVDDENGVALRARERELRDDAGAGGRTGGGGHGSLRGRRRRLTHWQSNIYAAGGSRPRRAAGDVRRPGSSRPLARSRHPCGRALWGSPETQKAGPGSPDRPVSCGRGERIRTSDPLHPMQVRYQAALRPDVNRAIIAGSTVGA